MVDLCLLFVLAKAVDVILQYCNTAYWTSWVNFPLFLLFYFQKEKSSDSKINICYTCSIRGFLSIDIDISSLKVNQCENEHQNSADYISISETQSTNNIYQHNFRNKRYWQTDDFFTVDTFRSTHKCHQTSMKVKFFGANHNDMTM